jgi:hypothetical protein
MSWRLTDVWMARAAIDGALLLGATGLEKKIGMNIDGSWLSRAAEVDAACSRQSYARKES